MATYGNANNSTDVDISLGSPAVNDGDKIVFSRFSTRFDTNVDKYAAKNLGGVSFIGAFAGSSVTPFKFGCNSGSGRVNVRCSAALIALTFGANPYDTHKEVVCNPTGPGIVRYSGAGTITKATVGSGVLDISEKLVTVTTVRGSGGVCLVQKADGASITTIQACGTLRLTSERAVSGSISIEPAAMVTLESDLCTVGGDVLVQGTFVHRGGDITGSVEVRPGGVLDFSKATKSFTIAGAANRIWAGATILLPPDGVTVTWTNAPELVGNQDQIPKYA